MRNTDSRPIFFYKRAPVFMLQKCKCRCKANQMRGTCQIKKIIVLPYLYFYNHMTENHPNFNRKWAEFTNECYTTQQILTHCTASLITYRFRTPHSNSAV